MPFTDLYGTSSHADVGYSSPVLDAGHAYCVTFPARSASSPQECRELVYDPSTQVRKRDHRAHDCRRASSVNFFEKRRKWARFARDAIARLRPTNSAAPLLGLTASVEKCVDLSFVVTLLRRRLLPFCVSASRKPFFFLVRLTRVPASSTLCVITPALLDLHTSFERALVSFISRPAPRTRRSSTDTIHAASPSLVLRSVTVGSAERLHRAVRWSRGGSPSR